MLSQNDREGYVLDIDDENYSVQLHESLGYFREFKFPKTFSEERLDRNDPVLCHVDGQKIILTKNKPHAIEPYQIDRDPRFEDVKGGITEVQDEFYQVTTETYIWYKLPKKLSLEELKKDDYVSCYLTKDFQVRIAKIPLPVLDPEEVQRKLYEMAAKKYGIKI